MMKYFIAFLFFMICYISIQAQNIELQGKVYSIALTPLINCNIKVSKKGDKNIISYLNTGEESSFNLKLKWTKPDTLLIEASYSGYKSQTITIIAEKAGVFKFNFNLEVEVKKQDEVIVTASQPTWKNGDTTFFKADAYKEPVQRKLGELIARLPGFSLDENGNLLYKNKIVQKITVDGEELFADKIKLLLKNIPLHIINTVQALENQNSNAKLKGLFGDGEVTVNIGLKKEKVNAFFGDIEVGAGTQGRYLVNPVLFKLMSTLKLGLISDINNYGKSLDYFETYQLKGRLYMEAESGNINNYGINIPNFNSSRYVRNNFYDNRLQLNFPLGKKIKSKTEISYIKDNQRQTSTSVSSVYSGTSFFDRTSAEKFINRPELFQLSQKMEWDVNKKSNLFISLFYNKDKKKYEEENFITQNNSTFNSLTKIDNNWSSLIIKLNFTKRITEKKALTVESSFGYFYFPQFILGKSNNWKTTFNLPDTAYTELNQNFLNKATFFKSKAISYFKIKKRVLTYHLNADWRNVPIHTNLVFNAPTTTLQPLSLQQFSGNGFYQRGMISTNFGYGFRAFKKPFILSTETGLINTIINEQSIKSSFLNPLLNISLKQEGKLSKDVNSNFDLSYQTDAQDLYRLHNNIYPQGVGQFSNFANIKIPNRSINLSHSIYFNFKYSSLSFYQNYRAYLSSHLNQPSFIGFVNFNTDSVVNGKVSNSYSINGIYTFPLLLIRSKISLSYNSSIFKGLILTNSSIEKSLTYNSGVKLEVKRNWNKKIFLSANSKLDIYKVKLPAILQSQTLKPTVNLINELSVKGTISKTLATSIIVEHIQNNLTSKDKSTGFFADAEIVKSFTKSKLSLRFKAENIFNQKQYLLVSRSSALYQSLYSVPLIGRNVFLSVRVEL